MHKYSTVYNICYLYMVGNTVPREYNRVMLVLVIILGGFSFIHIQIFQNTLRFLHNSSSLGIFLV